MVQCEAHEVTGPCHTEDSCAESNVLLQVILLHSLSQIFEYVCTCGSREMGSRDARRGKDHGDLLL